MSEWTRTLQTLLFLMLAVCLVNCAGTGVSFADQREMEIRLHALEQRLSTMEAENKSLREEHRQEMASLRSDLKNILEYLHIALNNLSNSGDLEKELGDVETSAKEALTKQLRQLLDLSRDMIEKLEQELKKAVPPKPAP